MTRADLLTWVEQDRVALLAALEAEAATSPDPDRLIHHPPVSDRPTPALVLLPPDRPVIALRPTLRWGGTRVA
jgi:hypothetical protein